MATDPAMGSTPFGTGGLPSAANPYSSVAYPTGVFGGASPGFGGYSSSSGYGGYGSYGSSFGGYGGMGYGVGYPGGGTGENLWQGVLGQAAESLGRANNFLQMTGMFVDHTSNHCKMLYAKGAELYQWYQSIRQWGQRNDDWMERLGFQIESGWKGEDEGTRRRRMIQRRLRTIFILMICLVGVYSVTRRRRGKNYHQFEEIYNFNKIR
jgi:hypothetical protein